MYGGGIGEVYEWRWGRRSVCLEVGLERSMYGSMVREVYVWRWGRRSVCLEVG